RPGLGSHVSSWLEPPASQSSRTCFCCRRSSPAKSLLENASSPPAVTPSAVATPPWRNSRRLIACSGEPQNPSSALLTSSLRCRVEKGVRPPSADQIFLERFEGV